MIGWTSNFDSENCGYEPEMLLAGINVQNDTFPINSVTNHYISIFFQFNVNENYLASTDNINCEFIFNTNNISQTLQQKNIPSTHFVELIRKKTCV